MTRPPVLAMLTLLAASLAARAAAGDDGSGPVVCYTGPSMKATMERLARTYEGRTGARIVIDSGLPQALTERIVESHEADLFVSHDPHLAILQGRGVEVRAAWNLASLVPMIAVPKGNPRRIRGLADLARPGLRVGLTDPDKVMTGNIAEAMFRKAGIGRAVDANVVMRAESGRDLADALDAGRIDAAFVWNAVVHVHRETIEAVDIPADQRPRPGPESVVESRALGRLELDHVRVTCALLHDRPPVRSFAQFIASAEGTAAFVADGFSPPDPSRPPLLLPKAPRAAAP